MKAVVRVTPSGYDAGDVIAIVESDHVFSENDLIPGHREAVEIGIITDEEKSLLLMEDNETPGNLFSKHQLRTKRRRKYKLDGLNIVKK